MKFTPLQERLQQNTMSEDDFRDDYSGRGMFGRPCCAITGTWDEVQQVIRLVAKEIMEDVYEFAIDATSEEELEEAQKIRCLAMSHIDMLLNYSQDSMGMGVVVYWPRLQPLPEEADSE